MIERGIDPEDGIILVTSVGEATRADIDEHYERLREMIADTRAAGQTVRVLTDHTRATRLSDELNHHIRAQMERTFAPEDRVALLMRTGEDKEYARRVLGLEQFGVFESRVAAEIWLMEEGIAPPGG